MPTAGVEVIRVIDRCGHACVSSDSGWALFGDLAAIVASGRHAIVDFDGVTTLTCSFLNSAIGCLYGRFSAVSVEGSLELMGLDEADRELVALVRKNAIAFYSRRR